MNLLQSKSQVHITLSSYITNYKTIKISVLERKDMSRIGGKIIGNLKILKALINLMFKKF